MTPERWAHVRQLFDNALERPRGERDAYLASACAGDAALRQEVETLLASYDDSTKFLAEPVARLEQTLISKAVLDSGSSLFSDTMVYRGEDAADYEPGYRLGQFRLERRIGKGGMGAVYEATRCDEEYEQRVAVKLVRRGMDSHEILRRFRLERQMLAGLNHPNIARLIDGGSTPDGLPYLVMEYVEGTPIDKYCEQNRVSITDRLKLFRELCSAVHYSHQNLIVHRDIKPGNILVTAERRVKLLDFGIAKVLRTDSSADAAQTRIELRPMTLEYASPEQVRGEPITTATDVYSLGVLLYRLLTGKSPYQVEFRTFANVQHAIVEVEPKKPSAVVLSDEKMAIPQSTMKIEAAHPAAMKEETRAMSRKRLQRKLAGDLDTIVLKALRKEPERRYASVDQFSEDLRRYLDGLPVVARGDTFGYRVGKFVTRHALASVLTLLLTLLLTGGAVWSLLTARRAVARAELAERRFADARQTILAGSTGAAYLDRLAAEPSLDTATKRDLAGAFLRVAAGQPAPQARQSIDRALAFADSVLAEDPSSADAQLHLARARQTAGELLAARRDWTAALPLFNGAVTALVPFASAQGPLHAQAALALGRAQIETAAFAAARETFTELRTRPGLSADVAAAALLGRGEATFLQGLRQEALPLLRDGHAAAAAAGLLAHRAAAELFGSVLEELGQPAEGIAVYQKLLWREESSRSAPRDIARASRLLARALVASGKTGDARVYLAKAATLLRGSSDLEELSRLLLEQREAALARQTAERAVSNSPGDPGPLDALAQAWAAAGNRTEAIAAAELALRQSPPTALRRTLEGNLARWRAVKP